MAEGSSGSGEEVSVSFGANITDLKEGISKVTEMIGKLPGLFAGITAALGGGEAFEKIIEQTSEYAEQIEGLQKQMGGTSQAASELRTALSSVGVSTSSFEQMFRRFNIELKSNSGMMQSLGVNVTAIRNGTISGTDAFVQATQVLNQYAPGIDRSQVALQLFGSRAGDVNKILELSNTVTWETATRLGQTRDELNASLSPLERYHANMETAAESTRALGLALSEEQIDNVKHYKEAMSSVGDVFLGVENVIGQALIPGLTNMAELFAQYGPQIVEVVGDIANGFVAMKTDVFEIAAEFWDDFVQPFIDGLQQLTGQTNVQMQTFAQYVRESIGEARIVLEGLRGTVEILAIEFGRWSAIVIAAVEAVVGVFNALNGPLAGMFARVSDAATGAAKKVADAWTSASTRENAALQSTIDKIKELHSEYSKPAESAEEKEKKGVTGKKAPIEDKGASALAKAQLALAQANAQAALALAKDQATAEIQIEADLYKQKDETVEEYYDHVRILRQQEYTEEIAQLNAQLAAMDKLSKPKNAAESTERDAKRVEIQGKINLLKQQEAETDAQLLRNEQAEVEALKNKQDTIAAQSNSNTVDAQIAQERQLAQFQVDEGTKTQEELAALEAGWEQRRFSAEMSRLAVARAQLHSLDKAGQDQSDADMLAARQKHNNALLKADADLEVQRHALAKAADDSIKSSFANVFSGLVGGTMTISQAFHKLTTDIKASFANLVSQKFSEKLFGKDSGFGQALDGLVNYVSVSLSKILGLTVSNEEAKTAAATEGAVERVAIQLWADVKSVASTVWAVLTQIGAYAWAAAAAVYAAIASIPYIGPFLAPVMAVAAGALVMGYASKIASAEGGWWQVPQDTLTNIHKDEMVLPAAEAQGLRSIIGGGGAGGGGAPVHIHARKASDVITAGDLSTMLKSMGRKHAFV